MADPDVTSSASRRFWELTALLGGWAVCLLGTAVMLYRRTYKPDWTGFLVSPPGLASMVLCVGLTAITWRVAVLVKQEGCRLGRGRFGLLLWPALLVGGVVLAGEATVRAVTEQHWWGEEIGSRLLLPRGWDHVVARYGSMLERLEAMPNYFVSDPQLGWTIGPSRTGGEGRWLSNQDGIRSSQLDGGYHLSSAHPCRVAVLGDSFTFGWEESFEQTMGYFLQQRLGKDCQVLNLGVPGYSLAQMLLRYERDVSGWNPTVLVLSFTDGAPARSLGVYCFLMMGDWDCPWAVPRFTLREGQLAVLNTPLPSPQEIYNVGGIFELPFVRADRWYLTGEWEQPYWRPLYASYLFRLATTWYPLHSPARPEVSDEAMESLNRAILVRLKDQATSRKTPLLILYQPKKDDYLKPDSPPYSPGLLSRLGLAFVDGRACLQHLSLEAQFRVGGTHYSTEGEQAMADCLVPHVRAARSNQVVPVVPQ